MRELEYPFDSQYIIQKKKQLKRKLLEEKKEYITKKIAVLGGSTTNDVCLILELFLLNYGIKVEYYESEYNRYYEDAMFPNKELEAFAPDIIYIHTTNRNIIRFPQMEDSAESVNDLLEQEYNRFQSMWDRLQKVYNCPIIQNNFEQPPYRILGNTETTDIHGKINYINKINMKFSEYAQCHESFYINDIHYISASYGLDKWFDTAYWYMYKYACDIEAIPHLCHNLANIIKAVFGKNKKAFVLDLDNTLWGGVIGDDGIENIQIGQETPLGQAHWEFQKYISEYKKIGVLLNVVSKNEQDIALAGMNHPNAVLHESDFISIKANWKPKHINIQEIADQLQILPDSMVFIDDNPVERELVKTQLPLVMVPNIGSIDNFIRVIDKSGYFEVTNISDDDMNRIEMYKENKMRNDAQTQFTSYEEFLQSLEMKAIVKPFEKNYFSRIAQLINKSNQFNLTTKRYTQSEIEGIAVNHNYM